MDNRVVVTGMGAVTPLGLSVPESWQNALNGQSGMGPITLFDAENFDVKIACEVKGFNPKDYFSPKEVRRRDRYELFASLAVKEALDNSGLELSELDKHRIGVIISSAGGGMISMYEAYTDLLTAGPRRVSPIATTKFMANGAAGLIAIEHGINGPSFSVASACASSADGIGIGWRLIRAGVLDIVIAGGSEATITPICVAGLDRSGAMSRRSPKEGQAPQPFDAYRDGFVMGEGAAVLILESFRHAQLRGATILAELAGYAATTDAFHITAPSIDGQIAAQAIRLALNTAEVNPRDVSYINAHGTATMLNDLTETLAIKKVFGKEAHSIPVSSTKSMTGHMIGATGALEAIFCVMAISESIIPPTINYQTPDPDCDLDYVPNQSRQHRVDIAVSNSFGFGGHNAVLVLKRSSGAS